jgi:HD-GYP domain-containing protein (c-di-GMP phosphodiesterase class II)
MGAYQLAAILFIIAGFCLVGLYLNHKLYQNAAAIILCTLIFLAMGFNLVDGAALHDPGVAAYPIFILCITFFFGYWAIAISALASVASVVSVYWMAVYGIIDPKLDPTLNRVLILSILYIATACLAWIIKSIWDETTSHLVQSYELTLQGWARALEHRDGETEGHCRRVTDLTIDLGTRFGLDKNEITNLRRGAYMHDIGKMAIPDSILFKPGPLDEDEWDVMKQHPVIAFEIISKIPFLQPAVAIPHYHHENWDGSGYPEGLKGTEIPFAARIFTVVDHWDALSSDRPYRKAWPTEKIKTHMKENSGKIYDPVILSEFLDMINSNHYEKTGHPEIPG